ncbi:RICIN domain-containing protein [Streptomyces sp. LUP30]|uniref:RICIN domain-containing protein n=1 Tax=Streptomyces sp. LUP30 TaxID=1890285 RepID=UPI00114CCF06|nr:RICIN domain-containing protein [Streptomyces sp. LUP30]
MHADGAGSGGVLLRRPRQACADVKEAAAADGARIIQWPSTGGPDQDWQIVAV